MDGQTGFPIYILWFVMQLLNININIAIEA